VGMTKRTENVTEISSLKLKKLFSVFQKNEKLKMLNKKIIRKKFQGFRQGVTSRHLYLVPTGYKWVPEN
jgi:uncharacterized membrane-anchored protein